MSDWTDRITIDEAAASLRAAIGSDLLGDRPAFILHDLALLRGRINSLKAAFPSNALHTVAIKANPLLSVLKTVVQQGVGLEAASIEEVQLALAAQCPADRVVFDSPAKTYDELRTALTQGVAINADNFSELNRIHDLLRHIRQDAGVGLRVNPQVGSGTIATTSVAGRLSKFGIPVSRRQEIMKAFRDYPWLNSLHAHVGSQGCDPQQLIDSALCLYRLRQEINADLGQQRIVSVDLGGGLPVAYQCDDQPLDIRTFTERLQQQVPGLFGPEVRLITEFGRSLQANCGVAFSRVEYVKDPATAVIHFGADLFLRWVYHPQDWRHELFVLDSAGHAKLAPLVETTVVGPLCFGGDVLARNLLLPTIEPGDWIGIRDVGAYTLSMWSRHCNRGLPLVLGTDGESVCVLHHGERPDDLVRFWS